jgi:hypothetical protein
MAWCSAKEKESTGTTSLFTKQGGVIEDYFKKTSLIL